MEWFAKMKLRRGYNCFNGIEVLYNCWIRWEGVSGTSAVVIPVVCLLSRNWEWILTGITPGCLMASLLRLILSVLQSTRDSSRVEGVDYAVLLHCIPNYIASYTLIYTHHLRLCNNTHDILCGEHCSHHWLVRSGYCDDSCCLHGIPLDYRRARGVWRCKPCRCAVTTVRWFWMVWTPRRR